MCCMMMHSMNHSDHTVQETQMNPSQIESPLEILRRRYALGEIDRAQLEEMQRVLGIANDDPRRGHAHR